MMYFNYHATAKKLIREGRLLNSKIFTSGGETLLQLYFDDIKHPVMTIKSHRIHEYVPLLGNIGIDAESSKEAINGNGARNDKEDE